MGRNVAMVWHASFVAVAAVLYFLFVLPRWWELTGFTPHLLGTVLRIVTAVLIGLAALPVVFTLQRTRRPEFGTPQLALTLLLAAIVGQVAAGVLIAGTAISEIWLSLDAAGPWLFGSYGAAAAIALLGIGAFYLSFVAEMPPPPPKPLQPKKETAPKRSRRSRRKGGEETSEEAAEETPAEAAEADEAETVEGESETEVADESDAETAAGAETVADLRPAGKRRAKGNA